VNDIERVQIYLRSKAAAREVIYQSPAFTVFGRHDDPTTSIAMPNMPEVGDAIPFCQTNPVTIQFLDSYAPSLDAILRNNAFVETERLLALTCSPATVRLPPDVMDVRIEIQDSTPPLDAIMGGLYANEKGFDASAPLPTMADAEDFRRSLVTSRAATAWLHEQPIGAGMFLEVQDGVTELVGVATLESFRRRGVAAQLTAALTRTAFEHGATLTFLSAANEAAGRVYARIGYQPVGWLRSYSMTK
jgi:ribosomal protein S18 acetylase RimI-like enzyme